MKLRELFKSGVMCGDNKYHIEGNSSQSNIYQTSVYSGEIKEEYLDLEICENSIEINGDTVLITLDD